MTRSVTHDLLSDSIDSPVAFLFMSMELLPDETPELQDDSDDEVDWEEVQVPEQPHLEITLHSRRKEDRSSSKSVSSPSGYESPLTVSAGKREFRMQTAL